VYEVNAGTYALLEPYHDEEVISYLILGADRAVLLDTGMGIGDISAEVAALTDLPVVVVTSHYHYDHVGDNYRFAEVWAFDNDMEVARLEVGLSRAECAHYLIPERYSELPPGFNSSAYEIRPAPVTRRLRHLEAIDLGGRTLTVHHTPGHSPGSLCLLDERDGLLFTGDTFYPGRLFAHFEGSDFGIYVGSMRHLVGLLDQVSHLCPAHNEAYVRKEMLAEALEAFEGVAVGGGDYELLDDDVRIYRFDGFSLTVPHVVSD
jgi:glyoxylase-like metal-dependent hydrolase (beta-lactamase superfamily II)